VTRADKASFFIIIPFDESPAGQVAADVWRFACGAVPSLGRCDKPARLPAGR